MKTDGEVALIACCFAFAFRAVHFPSESITVKSLPLRVSGVASWSVVMNTMPGFMRSSIAACTSAGGLMR